MKDPMTPELEMRSLHHFKWWWLFTKDGKPSVLFRRRIPNRDDWVIEWGDLDSSFFTSDDIRREFQRAWADHLDWIKANTP